VKNANAEVGRAIAALRKKSGLSQEELADRAGIHRTYVSQLERGLKSPTLQVLFALANSLNTKASKIVRMVEESVV
jgi:transcriptional regulator with XRE-family HTH domain